MCAWFKSQPDTWKEFIQAYLALLCFSDTVFSFSFLLAALCGLWDLSSPTRD